MILSRSFYARDTLTVARELLGKYLVFAPREGMRLVGKIVETEAYRGPQDKACHAAWRRRESCAALWGPPGFAYVYFTYGRYSMLNLVTEQDNYPAAVLIRALEPVAGVKEMVVNRSNFSNPSNISNISNVKKPAVRPNYFVVRLASGPGKLTQALGINYKKHNGLDLTVGKKLWVEERGGRWKPRDIGAAPRVGVAYAGAWAKKEWRFYLKGNASVSRK